MLPPKPKRKKQPDRQTVRDLEEMRTEVWHELEEGAIADVPDTLVDEIGELVAELEALDTEKKPQKKAH